MSGNNCAAAYKELLEHVNIVSFYDYCSLNATSVLLPLYQLHLKLYISGLSLTNDELFKRLLALHRTMHSLWYILTLDWNNKQAPVS